MKLIIDSIGTTVSVNIKEDREPWQRPTTTPGVIYVDNGHGFECGPEEYTTQEARELAAALILAADEAEGVTLEGGDPGLELAAVNDVLRDAGIEHPLGVQGVRRLVTRLEEAKEAGRWARTQR